MFVAIHNISSIICKFLQSACYFPCKTEQNLTQPTLMVISIDRNFFWSPTSMQLLIHGSCSLTWLSIRVGEMFSPPAVINNSLKKYNSKVKLTAIHKKLFHLISTSLIVPLVSSKASLRVASSSSAV